MKTDKLVQNFEKYTYIYLIGFLLILIGYVSTAFYNFILITLGIILLIFPHFTGFLQNKIFFNIIIIAVLLSTNWMLLININKTYDNYRELILTSILLIVLSMFHFWYLYCKKINITLASGLINEENSLPSIKSLYKPLILLALGIFAFTSIIPKLDYQPLFGYLWIGVIIIAALPFFMIDKLNKISFFKLTRFTKIDFIALFFILIVAILIYTHDLTTWRYSVVGDEYSFYFLSKRITEGLNCKNIFSFLGVYNEHPMFVSYLEAFFMKIYGINIWGWRMGYATFSIIGIISTYIFSRSFASTRYSVINTLLLVFSFFNIVFGAYHTQSFSFGLGFILLSIAVLMTALRKQSYLWLYIAGLISGMSLYGHYIGRLSLILLCITIIIFIPYKKIFKYSIPMFFGLLTTLQLFGDNTHLTYNTFKRTLFMKKEFIEYLNTDIYQYINHIAKTIYGNILNPFRSLFYHPGNIHFIYGPLFDAITVTGFIIGIIILIYWCFFKRNKSSIMLLAFFFIAFIITAVLADNTDDAWSNASVTRLYFLIPFITSISAIGLNSLLNGLFTNKTLQHIVLIIILSSVFIINQYRLNITYAYELNIRPEAVIIKTLQKYNNCKDFILIHSKPEFFLMPDVISNNNEFKDVNMRFISIDEKNLQIFSTKNIGNRDIDLNKAIIIDQQKLIENNYMELKSPNLVTRIIPKNELKQNYTTKIVQGSKGIYYPSLNIYIPKKD